jgi:Family of unknown function (DUF5947)
VTGGAGLRRFVRPPAGPVEPADDGQAGDEPVPVLNAMTGNVPEPAGDSAPTPEKCEMCATEVPAEHGHVADLEAGSLLCACRACYLLFTHRSAGLGSQARYRAVPDRYLADPGRVMAPVQWDRLQVPVGLAFFLRSSRADGELAGFYPSPAGATECRLDLQQWQQLVADFPLLGEPEPDVEAALISRSDDGVEYFLVPIDACYELAGRMRLYWHGFDGGAEARQSIADFLAMVRDRARAFTAPDTSVRQGA